MSTEIIGIETRVSGHPLLRILASFPVACFISALLTDIAYVVTANMMWADFSAWLLAIGLMLGVLAAIGGLIDLIAHRRAWRPRPVLPLALGSLVVLVIALFDNLIHTRDAWTSVMPTGLLLSVLLVLATVITVWAALGRPARVPPTAAYVERV